MYRRGKVQGNRVERLCLPDSRVDIVLKMAHDMPYYGHQAVRRTYDRIAMGFFCVNQWQCVKTYCGSCAVCQLCSCSRRGDQVLIKPTPRNEESFGHLQADLMGPIGEVSYRYTLVIADVQT